MKRLIYMLIPLFLFFSCEEADDDEAVVEDATLTGTWNITGINPYTDYNCSVSDEEDFINIPGITVTGTSVITDTEITQAFNYTVTGEWWCNVNGGTMSADGSSCDDEGESTSMSDIWNAAMCGYLGEDGGSWDDANQTCSVDESETISYTASEDGTSLNVTDSYCDCDYGDFDCEEDYNQEDCETTDGIYEEETYTYEVSITGNALTVTERSNDPDDAMCYCEDDEGNDIDGCDWDETDEAACTAAGGDYDNGEECSVWTFTKN